MGYGLYITRKDDWSDIEGPRIELIEWAEYLTIDPSLKIDWERSAEVDPRVASKAKEPTHTKWLEWPSRIPDEEEAWLWLEQGNLVAMDPDQAFRRKLFLIADGLGARLMGEEGELYDSNGDPETGRARLGRDGQARPWWKIW